MLTMANDFSEEDPKEDSIGESGKGSIYFSVWLSIYSLQTNSILVSKMTHMFIIEDIRISCFAFEVT